MILKLDTEGFVKGVRRDFIPFEVPQCHPSDTVSLKMRGAWLRWEIN